MTCACSPTLYVSTNARDEMCGLVLVRVSVQVVSGPHKGKSLSLAVGAAEVRVGRNAPKKNGLRLDNDFEVSDKCVTLQVPSTGLFLHATSVCASNALLALNFE